jgi:hypothetical protein
MSAQLIAQGNGIGLAITVALPAFPNVPNLPGVPQMARSLLYPPDPAPTIETEGSAEAIAQSVTAAPIWGVFSQPDSTAGAAAVQVVDADSVMDFGWRQEYRVSNYPVQQGAFASYKKVFVTFECSVTLTKGGTLEQRTQFLQQIDAVVASLDLFNIRTPEKTYIGCNCTRAELARRGPQNAGYFDVELFFVQISEVQAQYSSTNAPSTANSSVPSAVPVANLGNVQAQPASSQIQTQVIQAITPPVDFVDG